MDYLPIQLVDEDDNPIGGGTYEEVYTHGLLHRIVLIVIKDEKGNILMQKRGPKVGTYPGVWDFSAAGHVDEGESYEIAAKREVKEELRLNNIELTKLATIRANNTYQNKIMNRIATIYSATIPSDTILDYNTEEVAAVKWFDAQEVKRMINTKDPTLHPTMAIFSAYL